MSKLKELDEYTIYDFPQLFGMENMIVTKEEKALILSLRAEHSFIPSEKQKKNEIKSYNRH